MDAADPRKPEDIQRLQQALEDGHDMAIGALYSPFMLFLPTSLGFFLLGLGNYLYTLVAHGLFFTNMTALMLVTSILVFLIGIVSEQITMLIYKKE